MKVNWSEGALRCLAKSLSDQGDFRSALEYLEIAETYFGKSPEICCQTAQIYRRDGLREKAIIELQGALELYRESPDVLCLAAEMASDEGDFPAAMRYVENVLSVDPGQVIARFLLVKLLVLLGLPTKAEQQIVQILSKPSEDGLILTLWGQILLLKDNLVDAESVLRDVTNQHPTNVFAWSLLGKVLLLQGRFPEGWEAWKTYCADKAYWYWKVPLDAPLWDGSSISGTLIVDLAGDGLGDCIQFSRYLIDARQKSEHLICVCPEPLLSLLSRSFPSVQFITPDFVQLEGDYYTFIRILPTIFVRSASDIRGVPYLQAPPGHNKLRSRTEIFKIGICWSSANKNSAPSKCIPEADIRMLMTHLDAQLISLQYGIEESLVSELVDLNIDFSFSNSNLDVVAALIKDLDLIITIDTVYAHLAGALGAPTWLLLPKAADWRWFRGASSPWYDSVRIFRQIEEGYWEAPLTELSIAFEEWKQATQPRMSVL